ncbi:T9SS type A sorting domain-containing protein [candidate division KSB1 bacterium]|nr:T9SS type A sorting domain-containing protein [candidate division KSB1 bacterium]
MKSVIFLLFFASICFAQYDQSKIMDVVQGVEDGNMVLTVEPETELTKVLRAFDGNPYTEAIWAGTGRVTITLQLAKVVPISQMRIFWWNSGNFTLEIAETVEELDQGSGTYTRIADQQPCTFFQWDDLAFDTVLTGALRLDVVATGNQVIIGEWEITEQHTITSLRILPDPLLLLPETSLQMEVEKIDESGNVYSSDQSVDDMVWSSSDPAVASVTLGGLLRGHVVGDAVVTVTWGALSTSSPVEVLEDFRPELAEPAQIKVAVVYQNPIIPSAGGIRLHQKENWYNPRALVQQIIDVFAEASQGVVQFQVVETLEDDTLFTVMNGKFVTPEEVAAYLDEPNWQSLKDAHNAGTLYFDYNAMLDYYDFCAKREAGLIDEVWVYAWAYAGMYESQLTGDNAFWWNSPPLRGNSCHKLLSIMGLNYERGLPEGVHSFGHRMESAIRHVYGRWDLDAENPNAWEIFTFIDKDKPELAHVGNIHFPPNGLSDYDYGNRRFVKSYADNWLRYPYLFNIARSFNCEEWGCTQLGYLRWWYAHIPRYAGVTDGVLNNWWHYFYDYEGAVEKAANWTAVEQDGQKSAAFPGDYGLQQNYPNPFNNQTAIEFSLPSPQPVRLIVYDIRGRERSRLVDGIKSAGRHKIAVDASGWTSGIYFYRLETSTIQIARKLLLIK